jgi:tRNA 2-thiouridine synthesizing protein A
MAIEVDARGEKCPMPVVLLARAIKDAAPGDEVIVLCDDPAAEHDIPAWCRMRNATLIETTDVADARRYRIALAG